MQLFAFAGVVIVFCVAITFGIMALKSTKKPVSDSIATLAPVALVPMFYRRRQLNLGAKRERMLELGEDVLVPRRSGRIYEKGIYCGAAVSKKGTLVAKVTVPSRSAVFAVPVCSLQPISALPN